MKSSTFLTILLPIILLFGFGCTKQNTYTYEFDYPKELLNRSQENGKLTLSHSIPFEGTSPCDERTNPEQVDKLTDLDITMYVSEKNIQDTWNDDQIDSVVTEYFTNGSIQTSPGYIDEIMVDGKKGYVKTIGAGGCGLWTYYIPVLDGKTLVIKRSFGELRVPSSEIETYRQLPEAISPQEEEEIFETILETIKIQNS